MGAKTYNKVINTSGPNTDQTNEDPFRPWTGFESFWHEYCRKTGANPKWREMVKDHIEKLGWLNDQTQWEAGCKHFGIK